MDGSSLSYADSIFFPNPAVYSNGASVCGHQEAFNQVIFKGHMGVKRMSAPSVASNWPMSNSLSSFGRIRFAVKGKMFISLKQNIQMSFLSVQTHYSSR